MADLDPRILDLPFLRSQTAGDAALERDLLRLLLEQCTALLPLIVASDDTQSRRDAAHTLRGGAAGLGAVRLAATTAAIEEGREPEISIECAVAEIRETIERHLTGGESGPCPA
jgi:HPt (histidine-containing phosphotransfer) domain-containing protein